MKLKVSLIILLLLTANLLAVAQIDFKFKKGYIINNRNEKIECLIRDIGSEESAINFEYKFEDSKKIEKIELSKVKEFGIEDELKCVRALISVDFSPSHISTIKDTLPQWEEGHAFLKVLVEGEMASLYSHNALERPLYFFSVEGSNIAPLVHKTYYVEVASNIVQQILYDNTYKEQLDEYLGCDNLINADRVEYTKKDLVKYFTSYNKCKNAGYKEFKSAKIRRGILLLKPGIGLNKIQLGIHSYQDTEPKVFFAKENSIGFGIEAEYILPYNNYKWSLFTEANYLSYKTDEISAHEGLTPGLYDEYSIDYQTLELPIGITYYINLNHQHRFYVRGAYVPHFILSDSHIAFKSVHRENFSSSSRMLVGVGYNYRRIAIEFRYYTPQNITQNIYRRGSDLTHLSFKMSYAFQLFGDKGVR